MSEFEEILEEIGAFGPFQIRVFLLVSAFETPAAWAMLLSVFASSESSWTCPESSNYNDTHSIFSKSMYLSNSGSNYSDMYTNSTEGSCLPDNTPCPGHKFTGDSSTIVTEWDLICGRDYISHLTTTIQMIGVLFGAFITGQLADTFGRRRTFFIVYTLLLIVGFISSFAKSWQLYAVFRFIVGGLIGGTMLVNFVLPMEFIGPKWRTFCGCIGFWACGVMTLALLAFFIRDWRILSVVTSVGGILLLFTWWFIPESPRWLVQKGRMSEAKCILTQMAIFNKRPVPNFAKLEYYVAKEAERRKQQSQYSYWDLCRNIHMTKNTLVLIYAWFVSSSVYYGTSLNIGNLTGNRYLNFFLAGLVEIPALFFVVLVNNRIGRRKTLSLLMLLAGISMFAIFFVDLAGKLQDIPELTRVLALLGRCGIAGGWAAAQVYSAEVFPTVVRNIGIGACSMAARIGGVVAPQIVFLNKYSKPLPYVVFGSLALVCGVLSFLLPETRNQPLPDNLPPNCCCRVEDEDTPDQLSLTGQVMKDEIWDDTVVIKHSAKEDKDMNCELSVML